MPPPPLSQRDGALRSAGRYSVGFFRIDPSAVILLAFEIPSRTLAKASVLSSGPSADKTVLAAKVKRNASSSLSKYTTT